MADIYQGIYGTRYEASEPLYLTIAEGTRVWDRVKHRWLDWDSMVEKSTVESHAWQPREVGIPSIMWQLANFRGQYYGPGLDDTEALASEIVTNGELWTGAPVGSSLNTPPTGWTATNVGTLFQVFGGEILDIRPDPVLGGGMSQTLTGTPGDYYVVEVISTVDQNGTVAICLDGLCLPMPDVTEGLNSEMYSFSFPMPASGTVELSISIAPGSNSALDHIRCFLESELTGNPGSIGGGPVDPPMPEYEVKGPYMSGETTFFIQKFTDPMKECMVWLDVDSDPDPDVALTKMQVCESEIEDNAKLAIDAQLQADGCGGLPCMTGAGKLQKKYRKDADAE